MVGSRLAEEAVGLLSRGGSTARARGNLSPHLTSPQEDALSLEELRLPVLFGGPLGVQADPGFPYTVTTQPALALCEGKRPSPFIGHKYLAQRPETSWYFNECYSPLCKEGTSHPNKEGRRKKKIPARKEYQRPHPGQGTGWGDNVSRLKSLHSGGLLLTQERKRGGVSVCK